MGEILPVYVKKEEHEVLNRFKEWCITNRVSASKKAMSLIHNFVLEIKLIEPIKLERFQTCRESDKTLRLGVFYCLKDKCPKIPIACYRCKHYKEAKK